MTDIVDELKIETIGFNRERYSCELFLSNGNGNKFKLLIDKDDLTSFQQWFFAVK
ncbi:hypothetical protein [Methylocucumis oryzae]|uniref:hypothetical protein n=1 Tax=Methylocucumis oryzae TaxID=1632867 RepID=UPI0012FED832|nr:hypothetical protein [Methylocucumis oryzae]